MTTPHETKSGMAIAELNNIPTYTKGRPPISDPRNTRKRYPYLDRRSERTDELCKRDTEKLGKYDGEQLEPGSFESGGSGSKPDRVNHQNPVHDRADDRVGDL